MEAAGEFLQGTGAWLMGLGVKLMPLSLAAYLPFRWVEYRLRSGYTRMVKALWYVALGGSYVVGFAGAGLVATYICFIEACDLVFQQLEANRERAED